MTTTFKVGDRVTVATPYVKKGIGTVIDIETFSPQILIAWDGEEKQSAVHSRHLVFCPEPDGPK